jgi:autonomous glycyl radical cofactor GrcA
MRYFHRTPLSPDAVLQQADAFFGQRMAPTAQTPGHRGYRDVIGMVTVDVRIEGGHYTNVTVGTDQVGESEVDKLAKRFLSTVHAQTDHTHVVRGAY